MNTRRNFLMTTGAGVLALSGLGSRNLRADEATDDIIGACTPFDSTLQAKVTPDMALQMLKEGNERFVNGVSKNCDLLAQINATATQQAPFAAVVGCIDSRVPVELVFDQQIGDIFAARIAGNFVNTDIIGSLEFGTLIAGAKLIVVLGHTECGAVKGAVDNAELGNLTATLANIRPAVLKTTGIEGPQTSENPELVQAVADQNVLDAVARLQQESEVLRGLVAEGKLKIAGAMHDVGSGRIHWFS
jgi:carbonic anhydrase